MLRKDLAGLIEKTPFVDTHEHLVEESYRVMQAGREGNNDWPAPDIFTLFSHYADSDLRVAGMPEDDVARLWQRDLGVDRKWKLIAPYYARCRHTGYVRAVRESLRLLWGEEDLDARNVDDLSRRFRSDIRPGYYRCVLREAANCEYAQVNAIDVPIFRETEMPDLLAQDLSFVSLATQPDRGRVRDRTGRDPETLDAWHDMIDWCFATWGPRAIAVKNQSAYARALDYAPVPAADAAQPFLRWRAGTAPPEDMKALTDHLFHYCIERAIEYRLPIKLHTGYFAGQNYMPLHRVKANLGDLCPILQRYPKGRFVLMHVAYPYQDEAIAIAKHYENVTIDLCWAWIINPAAMVRFVKEFLMAAPANKLLGFGGDYRPVEVVPGHAAVARQGLGRALADLAEEGWIDERDLPELVERLMRGNAHELFDLARTLKR